MASQFTQGKDAVYACGRTGGNVSKILAWARHQGPKRGEFHTTGAIAMVVGMPNVGKSSLINLLLARGKALRRHSSGKGAMEAGQQQVQVEVSYLCIYRSGREEVAN